ncbi:RHS repeat domain-containing protein [Pseudomonas sp. PDM31]|uniref:RHS repeat domain-containing protein n=1 Tax=Pseudomonas sp. PDM31 TaxID=2854778 RepID=UPI001C45645C|nr:sugar-binding protein [Pseudomonas sp. PDM31]MBV7477720.1 sugar-binding protein [Pseudomonas sp. PDM31]
MSYLQGGVDPRTGQYTLSIDFPEVKSNWLGGPAFPVSLAFNPINILDSGYGRGWNLNLTQFTPHNSILSLHTGETFKVTGSGTEPSIKEKKLDSFHFQNLGNDWYRVTHKSGLVELLEVGGSSTDRVALPKKIYSPAGHCIELDYDDFRGGQRLASIRDAQGELLRINRPNDTQVEILIRPYDGPGGGPLARYEMNLNGSGWVTSIVLPTADKASWRFGYGNGPIRDILCLHEVHTPTGGRETLDYGDLGHPYPGGVSRPNLPRVTRHRSYPGFDQPMIQVDYSYTNHNFLGFGETVSWEEGMDPLYKVRTLYDYGSTATLMDATDLNNPKVVRTVKRTYNRFHLLTEETTTQQKCIKQVKTDYYAEDIPFEQQVAQFQLPRKVTTIWTIDKDPTQYREEVAESEFDTDGNQTRQVEPNGLVTTYTYYLKEGEDGCPPDRFVRNLKDTLVTPSPQGKPGAPTLRTRLRYAAHKALTGSGQPDWLAIESETLAQINGATDTTLQQTQRTYHVEPADAFLHARPQTEQTTLNGKTSTTSYEYERLYSALAGATVLQTTATFKGFDDVPGKKEVRKKIISEDSLLHGQPLLTRDDNNVRIRYVYDALMRVLSETVAPDEPEFEATRHYEYYLTSIAGQQASQVVTDVKGVKTRSLVDGLNRPIYEERHDADNPQRADKYRQTWSASYDLYGNLREETHYDWRGAQQVAQTSTFEYDDWGMQRSVTGPDGVTVYEQTNPIGTSGWRGPIQSSWREGPGKVGGKVVTYLNLFEKPDHVERFEIDQSLVSKHQYVYDGFGRTVEETDASDATTTYAYDAFDRLIINGLPGGAEVRRCYAEHSSADLPTKISVDDVVLGEQTFDGLDRMIESITGGRVQSFTYNPGQTQPATVTTASNQVINYAYQPQLGDEPSQRSLPDKDPAEYERDGKNARLVRCKEDDLELQREYFTTGEMKSETRVQGNQTDVMHYDYSRQGLLLSYTDVRDQVQTYHYDDPGRLEHTELGTTFSDFTFDTLGQPLTIKTRDSASGQQVTISLEHDGLGREIKRTFDLDGVLQVLSQVYNKVDLLVRRTLREGQTLLRDETYEYDPRGRLVLYKCEGSEPPVDPYGKAIVSQRFMFDAMDNLKRVTTTYQGPGGTTSNNIATYRYTGTDPTQLSSVTNSASGDGYPALIELEYDWDGRMTRDEEGRFLEYDALGRLIRVSALPGETPTDYDYDPLDKISGGNGDGGPEQRFYRNGVLVNRIQGASHSTFMHGDNMVLAEYQEGDDPKS